MRNSLNIPASVRNSIEMSTLSNYSNIASLYLRRDNINLTQL